LFSANNHSPTAISTLSLHDALPIFWVIIPTFNSITVTRSCLADLSRQVYPNIAIVLSDSGSTDGTCEVIPKEFSQVVIVRGNSKDRKSTRLNSSHVKISYAVFCLKK